MSDHTFVKQFIQDSMDCIAQAKAELTDIIVDAAEIQARCLQAGNKILIAGNGGSATDSQHYSGELLNKYLMVRKPLAAISLASDISTLTSISNDESYDVVFSKQVEALGRPGDILVVITSSGNSRNLVNAVTAAQKIGMQCIALNGKGGGILSPALTDNDLDIVVSGTLTSHVQEVHGIIIHLFCDLIDQHLFAEN